jgi:hypothetical protein
MDSAPPSERPPLSSPVIVAARIGSIDDDDTYELALLEIRLLWAVLPGSPGELELYRLAALVSAYETRRWPVAPPAPDPGEPVTDPE